MELKIVLVELRLGFYGLFSDPGMAGRRKLEERYEKLCDVIKSTTSSICNKLTENYLRTLRYSDILNFLKCRN